MEIRKQDHNEIKAYLINYINTLWNKDKDFVEVYGKDYPKIQLERNLREFKFNRSTSLNISGEYDLIRRNIYVYNYKYPILTLHNLIKSQIVDSLMKTILHELIQAVFSKNLDTEQDPNKHVTGLEIYDEVHKKLINSPLNEGYTEYLRSKLDKKREISYSHYVRIFYLLEKRIGRKNVIALGKGDVLQNMSKAFNMTQDEFMEFCRNSEKKFIRERKLEVLESEYKKLCEEYPEDAYDVDRAKKAIIKFDKSVHKSLYGNSIADILPIDAMQEITLEDFHKFMRYKIRESRKQMHRFHEDLYNIAKKASTPNIQTTIARFKNTVFGFIRIYNPEEKSSEIRLEYYDEPYTMTESGKCDRANNDGKTPKIVTSHDLFVSSIRSKDIRAETTETRRKIPDINSSYNIIKNGIYNHDMDL